ncbi:MAG: hypothetical protein SFV55_16625 [Haliscomenobacter sp.]|uniref:hypothetical protein n=1 Tax=Haliscomenobacter sp. TaxID=2717303 RepID=UPI0029BCAEB0|nr:hypothetical protein [Haliscomenobacter sp.]MDX2070054.1 hypothetical protein [Haliscomenobacter sp.]
MNPFLRFLTLAFLLSPLSLMAQSPVGSWKLSVPDDKGNMIPLKVDISDQGTYTLDFGADGSVETKGKYTMDGAKMTVQDIEGSDCAGAGVYTLKVEGDTLTMTRVSDPCTNRGGPEGVIVMKKG